MHPLAVYMFMLNLTTIVSIYITKHARFFVRFLCCKLRNYYTDRKYGFVCFFNTSLFN